jgi:hypothetical protein
LTQQVACASNSTDATAPRTNKIVCFRLDGSLDTLIGADADRRRRGGSGTDGD